MPRKSTRSARVERSFLENGWVIAKSWQTSNLILLNACGVTQKRSLDSLRLIKEIESQKTKNQTLIVWGCLPKIDPKRLANEYTGLISAGSEIAKLHELVGSSLSANEQTTNSLLPLWTSHSTDSLQRATGRKLFVKVKAYLESKYGIGILGKKTPGFFIQTSTGCFNNCSYCGIKKSREFIVSKPIKEVENEFNEGLMKGYEEFSLLGTDLGSYGFDLGYKLSDLLNALISHEGKYQINLRNVNPLILIHNLPEFTPILQSGRIRYIEVPVQSGSNRILGLMNRGYTIEEYKNCIGTIRKTWPKIIIRTQFIVGFPTETEQEFLESIKLVDEGMFDFVEVFSYSERPETASVKITPKVLGQNY